MQMRMVTRFNGLLETWLPEKRFFLRDGDKTRFIRLRPATQIVGWTGTALILGWTVVASSIILVDSIGAGNFRAQALREQSVYADRLNQMASERDSRAAEAAAARERFDAALEQVSLMQTQLLRSEEQRRELVTGIEMIQATLRQTATERNVARERAATADPGEAVAAAPGAAMQDTVDFLSTALASTATERDMIAADAEFALDRAAEMELELELLEEKNDAIFRQLEEAMLVSVEPLDKMFRDAGMDPDALIGQVRRGYSGLGGPATPIQFSTRGGGDIDPAAARASAILDDMDRINLYRIAAERAPFAIPVKDSFRYTSGFGPRWGRMHNGTDFAGAHGTPIYSTADGVVIQSGRASGYGLLVKIQHEFGIETRYAHMSKLHVKVGQRVSRGEQIGDMGNTGRSTGTHLHYEVRVGGNPVNPMIYIKAGQDVF